MNNSKQEKIVIIPARSGSVRIKNKNLKKFNQIPIILETIKKIKKMRIFDKIYVSTDSKKIAELVVKHGAVIPYIRSKKLSNSYASTNAVIKDFIIKTEKITNFNLICCIYPTSIFINKDMIKKGISKLSKNIDFSFSATNYSYPVQKSFKILNNKPNLIFKKYMFYRSQDLQTIYHDAAQFYVGYKDKWKNKKFKINQRSFPVLIKNNKVQDIDTIDDWEIARLKFKLLKG